MKYLDNLTEFLKNELDEKKAYWFKSNKDMSDIIGMVLRIGWCNFFSLYFFELAKTNKVVGIYTLFHEYSFLLCGIGFWVSGLYLLSGFALFVGSYFLDDIKYKHNNFSKIAILLLVGLLIAGSYAGVEKVSRDFASFVISQRDKV